MKVRSVHNVTGKEGKVILLDANDFSRSLFLGDILYQGKKQWRITGVGSNCAGSCDLSLYITGNDEVDLEEDIDKL